MDVVDGRRPNRLELACAATLALVVAGSAACAQTPQPTELPGSVFSIRHRWSIGGEGNWDYLTLDAKSDASAPRLYIAHGAVVQVVDVASGKLAGQVTGLRDAHEIALDDQGQFGYVSDGPADEIKVFDRQSFEVVAKIPTGRNPRALVFEPASHLLFVICPADGIQTSPSRRAGGGQTTRPPADTAAVSTITVIDADTQKRLGDLLLPGRLGFVQSDGKGRIYINVTDRNQIATLNAQTLESPLRKLAAKRNSGSESSETETSNAPPNALLSVDWSESAPANQPIPKSFRVLRLQDCQSPRALSVDSANERLFVACDNRKMQVLNAGTGETVASLPIGAGTDALGYDAGRGLIYASNGGGVGSLTIIRQHLTDSYAVIQELPTQARARTLAVNPISGEVYLVTNVTGFDLTHPGGVGDLKPAALQGSFEVLVVGN